MTAPTTVNYTYDANGNRISQSVFTHTLDASGKLVLDTVTNLPIVTSTSTTTLDYGIRDELFCAIARTTPSGSNSTITRIGCG